MIARNRGDETLPNGEDTVTIFLRVPPELKEKIEQRAKEQKQSVNAMLKEVLAKQFDSKTNSLEKRNFIGQRIASTQIDASNGLVLVRGIYYRYLIEGNQAFDSAADYIVLEANGNILTLRPIKN